MFRSDNKIVLVTNKYVPVGFDQMELTWKYPSLSVDSVDLDLSNPA